MIQKFASAAIGLIPGVGPLMAFAFDMAWQAIEDPDSFLKDPLGLGTDFIAAVIMSAGGVKNKVKPGMAGKPPRSMGGQTLEPAAAEADQAIEDFSQKVADIPVYRGREPEYVPFADTTESIKDEADNETIVVFEAAEDFVDPYSLELADFSKRGSLEEYLEKEKNA